MMRAGLSGLVLALCWAAPGAAQDATDPAFTGPYAGIEVGAHEHHIYFTESRNGQVISDRYYRAWGIGGGAFAGYDWAVAPRLRLGGEAELSIGGASPQARFSDGTTFSEQPRAGYRVTAHAGYLPTPRLMVHGSFGYGGHGYRVHGTAQVQDARTWGSSFVIGGGIAYRLSNAVDVRLDFKHLDNQMSHILVGVPIRF